MAQKDDNTADELKGMDNKGETDEGAAGGEAGLGASSGSEGDFQAKRQRMNTPSPKPVPFMVQPSPPKFVTFDDLMEAANGVKNMSLAHEIAVDASFKLEKMESPKKGIQHQVKEIVHKAFWDAFEAKVSEDPPDFSHAVVLIQEVKEALFSFLLPQHSRFKAQLTEVLDMELIQQKLEQDAFDIYYYSDYVINIMSKLCSPARDDRIAKLRDIKDVIPLFKEIFEVLDLMKMDMANFTIQQIRPYIQQQSVDYEKAKFEEFLKKQQESGIDGLELTRLWLARSFDQLQSGESTQSDSAAQANLATPSAILTEAYMELLQWENNRLFPETLVLDQSRYLDLRDQTTNLTLVTSVLLVTYNTVGQSIAGVQALKVKLKDEICTILKDVEEKDLPSALENVGEQVNKNVDEFLKGHGYSTRDEQQNKALLGQIKGLSSKENPVITLMSKRVLSFIQQALFVKQNEPMKVPAGMSVMEKELSQICGQFLRLISHNRSVFGQHYASILGTLLKRQQEDLA